jgi:signal transduction histidine kinase
MAACLIIRAIVSSPRDMAEENITTAEEARAKVLLVDDDDEGRKVVAARMERDGHEVVTGKNGVEAVAIARAFKPDIILLDVMMPVMDGFEALRILKGSDETRYIPVIMLTGKIGVDDKVSGLGLGAEDYIGKPYDLAEISARVQSMLRSRRTLALRLDAEKMAALGSIVDGIAHEIRNPLTTIGGLARRVLKACPDDKARHAVEAIVHSVERMEAMVRRIEDYKDALSNNPAQADLNAVVLSAVDELREFVDGRDIEIDVALEKRRPMTMRLDAKNMRLAVFSVLKNAAEAVAEDGRIRVETWPSSDGQSLCVRVIDNGHGIPAEDVERIFNPFHTSKMTGSGMGLTISRRVVNDHGGTISVASKPGEGAVFTIRLTLAGAPA